MYYFVTGLAGGVLLPYLSIIFKDDGFNSTQIGVIMAAGTLISVLVQPVFGYIVDRFQVIRLTLVLSSLIPGAVAIVFQIHWLWLVVLANLIFNLFSTPQTPIADSYAINSVRKMKQSYGSIRLFGSLGWAIAAYFGGLYVGLLPVESLWVPYLVLSLLSAAAAMTFSAGNLDIELDEKSANNTNASIELHAGPGTRGLLHNHIFWIFLAGGFLASQTLTAFNTYFAITFQNMGGSLKLAGVAFFLASSANVPSMLLSTRVIQKVGRENVLVLASVAYIVRWGVQAWVHIPIVAILIQVLHGVSFGFYYVAAVDFVSKSASRELQATAQAIFGVVCSGVAGIVGNLLNGYLLSTGGPDLMFGACAFSALLATICFFVVSRSMAKLNRIAKAKAGVLTLNP